MNLAQQDREERFGFSSVVMSYASLIDDSAANWRRAEDSEEGWIRFLETIGSEHYFLCIHPGDVFPFVGKIEGRTTYAVMNGAVVNVLGALYCGPFATKEAAREVEQRCFGAAIAAYLARPAVRRKVK